MVNDLKGKTQQKWNEYLLKMGMVIHELEVPLYVPFDDKGIMPTKRLQFTNNKSSRHTINVDQLVESMMGSGNDVIDIQYVW